MPIVLYSYYNSHGVPNNITPGIAASIGAQPITNSTPVWRDITISNLTATTQSGYVAGIIWGRPEMAVSNVTLCDIDITASKAFDVYNARDIHFLNTRIAVPAGNSTHAIYNAGITLSNSAGPVLLDGLNVGAPTNSIALHDSSAASVTPDLVDLGTRFTLDRSILGMPGNWVSSSKTAMHFYLGTEASRIAVSNNLILRGTVNISSGDGFTHGTYTSFSCGAVLLQDAVLGVTPLGYACSLSTNTPGQVNLIVTKAQPHFRDWTVDSAGLTLGVESGIPHTDCVVLTSTNLHLPVPQWEPVATNQFDATGTFLWTDALRLTEPQRYFALQIR
jgi:hypothetical protein